MSRNFFIGTLAILLIIGFLQFVYKTPLPVAATAEFGGVSLILGYATTEAEREKGLSGRTSVPSDYGMLFVFQKEDYYGFWMKDMLVPIDIFWLDSQGQVVSIAEDVTVSTYPSVFYPNMPVRYVLETAAGFSRAHSVATGTPLLLKNFPTVSE
ncbi:MAG: DUF192 domain-containing protein [Candidatus Paceibacterota bacterium]|jgi:hypothetical protein